MYQKIDLANKSRLILAPLQETLTANILVMAKVGSRHEKKWQNGASHFIEHLMFKGTKKRPNTLAIARELDGVGAEYNAFTSKDYTGYYIKADAKHLDLAVEVLADMLLNSKFDSQEVAREKKVIIEEINMYEDNPLMYVEDLLEGAMFRGTSLGRLIAGTRQTVGGLTRDQLVDYKDKFYQGPNLVIGLAGRFADRQVESIKRIFKFKARGKFNQTRPINIKQNQPRLKVYFKETEQVQLAIGFPAYQYSHPRIYALRLLSVILGGNMSSRLFLRVREREGLAYFVRSSLNIYEDTGGLIIQAGLDKMRIERAVKLILTELKKFRDRGPTQEELKRAKEFVAGKIALDLEDTSGLALWYAKQALLTKEILTPSALVKKINAVSRDQMLRAAREVINFRRLNLAVIGPFKSAKAFSYIIKP